MDAKAFLELNDRMIAFNTLMSGALAKETAEAKAAIDLLGGAQAIQATQATLDATKASLDAREASIAIYEATVSKGLQEHLYALDQDDLEHQIAAAALEQDKLAFEAIRADFQAKQDQLSAGLAQDRADLQAKSDLVEADRIALDAGFSSIAKREADVAAKLAAMKAIV